MAQDPNIHASAKSVSDKLDGIVNGQPLNYRMMALLHPSNKFSLRNGDGSYPYPEGANPSSSLLDGFTTLAKILGRTYVAADGKEYDMFDAVMEILDHVLAQKA